MAKSYIRTLLGSGELSLPDGTKVSFDSMRVCACEAKTGYSFYVQFQKNTKVGKKSSVATVARGATSHYPDLATATAAVDAGVVKAQAAGYVLKPSSGRRGFAKAVDSFTLDTLPAPAAAAAEATKPSKSKK